MRTSTAVAVVSTSIFLRVGLPFIGAALALVYGDLPAALAIIR